MATPPGLVTLDPTDDPAASCLVCGSHIPAGAGVTAMFRGVRVRFRCEGCLSRFEADPWRFLGGHAAGCCHADENASPASEWCA